MLRSGDAQAGDVVKELAELRNFKISFGQWVNERLATERAALTAAQNKILAIGVEVDDRRATDVKTMTQMYEITDELGQARARIAAITQENLARQRSCTLDQRIARPSGRTRSWR